MQPLRLLAFSIAFSLAWTAVPALGQNQTLPFDAPVRGIVKASAEATISTDISAVVTQIGFREGETFRAGDLLIAFNCRTQNAQLAAAKAEYREKQVVLRSAEYLFNRNAGSKQEVDTSRAQLERAAAEVNVISTRLERCEIRAPYSGSVADLTINEYETARLGAPLLSIVRIADPEIELIVPSNWINQLSAGQRFDFIIDENEKTYTGVVQRMGAKVDAVSQTIRVFATFGSSSDSALPGMSGTARFSRFSGLRNSDG